MNYIDRLKELEEFDYKNLIFEDEDDGDNPNNEIVNKSSNGNEDDIGKGGDEPSSSQLIKSPLELDAFADFLGKLNSILKEVKKYKSYQVLAIADEAIRFQNNLNKYSLMRILDSINKVLKIKESNSFGIDFPLLYLYFCFISSSKKFLLLKEGTMAYYKVKLYLKDVSSETLSKIKNSGFYNIDEKQEKNYIYFTPIKDEIVFVKELQKQEYKNFFNDDRKIAATIDYRVPDFSKEDSIDFKNEAEKLQKALNATLAETKKQYDKTHKKNEEELNGSKSNDIVSFVNKNLSNDSSSANNITSGGDSSGDNPSKNNLKSGNPSKDNSSPKNSNSLNTKTKTLYGLPVELPDDINKENVNSFFEKIKDYIKVIKDKHIETIKNRLKSDEGLFSIKTEDAIKKLFFNNNIVIKEVYDFVSADGNTDKLKAITDEAEDIIKTAKNKIFDLFGNMKSTSNYKKRIKLESQIVKELDNAAYQVSKCLGKIDSMSLRNNLQTIYNNSKKKAIKDDKESANTYKYSQLSRVVDSILMSDEAITPEAKIAQYYIWNLLDTNPSVQQLSKNLSSDWASKYIGTKSDMLYVPYPSTIVLTRDSKGSVVIDFTKLKITSFLTPKDLLSKKLLGVSIGNNYEELAKVLIDWYKEKDGVNLKVKTEAKSYLNRYKVLSSSMTVNSNSSITTESLTDFVRGLNTKRIWKKNNNGFTLNKSGKKLSIVQNNVINELAKLTDDSVKALTPQNIALAQAFYNHYLVIENGEAYLYTADGYKEKINNQAKQQAVANQNGTGQQPAVTSSIEIFKKKLFS